MQRPAYAALALIFGSTAVYEVATLHTGLWQLIAFAVAPDLPLLGMAWPGLASGQLHPRAVPVYNAVHRFWVPGLLMLLAFGFQSPAWLVGGMAWWAHIALDRSLGFGLRDDHGFQRQRDLRS